MVLKTECWRCRFCVWSGIHKTSCSEDHVRHHDECAFWEPKFPEWKPVKELIIY